MQREFNNVRVIAENNAERSGFNIYLDFSGKREYIMTYRHNGLLFNTIKDGIRLNDLKRAVSARSINGNIIRSTKLLNSLKHMLVVIDDYLR